MKFVIFSGLSGAGKTTALKAMENMGFFCVDNLPSILLTKFADLCFQGNPEFTKVAVGIDVRGRQFFDALDSAFQYMEKCGYPFDIVFLSCEKDVLVNRYNFTRHVHPLADEGGTVLECIQKEAKILEELRKNATYLIDTTKMQPANVKNALERLYGEAGSKNVRVYVYSFGFKRGVPVDADYIFDARFLPNPYNDLSLRPHSGREKCVMDYLSGFETFHQTVEMLFQQLKFIIPQYHATGKQELSYAIGCTGGYHRSVALAVTLTKKLEEAGFSVVCEHRDMELEGEKWKDPSQQ